MFALVLRQIGPQSKLNLFAGAVPIMLSGFGSRFGQP